MPEGRGKYHSLLSTALPMLWHRYYLVEKREAANYRSATATSYGDYHDHDGKSTWFTYFPDIAEQVEATFKQFKQSGHPPSELSITMDNPQHPDGITYKIDFSKEPMQQVNIKTGYSRMVMRKPDSYIIARPDAKKIKQLLNQQADPFPQGSGKSKQVGSEQHGKAVAKGPGGVVWEALDPNSAAGAVEETRSKFKSTFGVASETIALPGYALTPRDEQELQKLLAQDALCMGLVMKSNKSQASTIEFTGCRDDVDSAKAILFKTSFYGNTRMEKKSYPANWTCTDPGQVAYPDVPRDSAEWHGVAAKLLKDLPSVTVTRVQRVQNDVAWKSYQHNLAHLRERYTVNGRLILKDLTRELWHGTSLTKPEVVAASPYALEFVHSNPGCMWGAGNYMSTVASYCVFGYEFKMPSGERQLMLMEALTGVAVDLPAQILKKPPLMPADHPVMQQLGMATSANLPYDSVTGITKNARVYITYSSQVAQQYPHYIVTYK